jgi:hypothetical protein
MWPGSDLPVGPPPHQPPPPPPEPPRIRPAAGWYAVPMVLLAIAVVIVVAAFAANWDESEAADGPRRTGDARAGIRIEVTGGHDYFLFVRTSDPSPTACALAHPPGTDAVPVPLTRANSWTITPPTGYRHGATFTAPRSGTVEVTCEGTAGPVQVVPDDTSYGYMALGMIGSLLVAAAGVIAFIVILVMRMNSAKRHRAAAMDSPGLHVY